MQQSDRITVQFPHGPESLPATINEKRVRFVSIDEDGALIAWAVESAPILDESMGVWIGETAKDFATIRTVGDGKYPAYTKSMRSILSIGAFKAATRTKVKVKPVASESPRRR